jgi:hypothetical protein
MPIAFDDGRLPVQSALRERLTPATTARTSLSSHPDAIMFRPLLFAPAAPNLARLILSGQRYALKHFQHRLEPLPEMLSGMQRFPRRHADG